MGRMKRWRLGRVLLLGWVSVNEVWGLCGLCLLARALLRVGGNGGTWIHVRMMQVSHRRSGSAIDAERITQRSMSGSPKGTMLTSSEVKWWCGFATP